MMAIENLYQEVLMRPPSSPMKNWIFNVSFLWDGYDNIGDRIQPTQNSLGFDLNNDSDRSMIAIKVDLPSFDTTLVTKSYLGTQKSFPVLRKHSGETTLTFYMHTDPHENNFIVYNFFKKFNDLSKDQEDNKYYHKEFATVFNEIDISVMDREDGNVVYIYYLKNCIVTKVDMSELNYEGGDAMKYNMTVHYDDWWVTENDVTENEVTGKGSR